MSLNRIVRVTVPHHYDFGKEARVGRAIDDERDWDVIRTRGAPAFRLPPSRAEFEARAADAELAARAVDIVEIARRCGARSLCSYGVGAASLELNVARLAPELRLVCTDYAPETASRITLMFPEAEIVRHDIRVEEPRDVDLHLLHRVDTELSTTQWHDVFRRFPVPVLFVPAAVLSWSHATRSVARLLVTARKTRAGYSRNEAALRALWSRTHDDEPVRVGSLHGFLLEPREPA